MVPEAFPGGYNGAMTTRTITLDERTDADLQRLSATENTDPNELAARLLRRAIRAARPRPAKASPCATARCLYDLEAIKANAAEFASEDEALAESDIAHRADLLAQEDAA